MRGHPKTLFCASLSALILAVLLVPPVAAQGLPEGDPVYTSQGGSGYEVYEDGTLIIGGDVLGSCDTVLQEVQQTGAKPTRGIYTEIEICEEAGFRVPGVESLPETGGPPVPAILAALPLVGAVLLLGVRR